MKNLYHSDIYKFDIPVSSYWEDISSEKLNFKKLTQDTNSEIVVIGGGYTGLLHSFKKADPCNSRFKYRCTSV